MDVDTIPICLVVIPLALENVSINMPELSLATCFIEHPVSFVFGTIFPHLHTIPMLHVSKPLASVGSSILKVDFRSGFKLRFVDVIHLHGVIVLVVLDTVHTVNDEITICVIHVIVMRVVHFA